MYTKQLLIGVLATFLTLGLFGTAFASSVHSSEAGDWQHSFNLEKTAADHAAMNHQYDGSLSRHTTEAGDYMHTFNNPETSADIAARNHVYMGSVSRHSTEAGDYRSGLDPEQGRALCSTC